MPTILRPACLALAWVFLHTAPAATQAAAPALMGSWEGEMRTEPWPRFITLTLHADGAEPAGELHVLGRAIPAGEVRVRGDSVTVRIGSGPRAVHVEAARSGDGRLVGTLAQGDDVFPFALRRVPDYPEPRSREEAWAQDVDALATRFIELDRSFTPARRARFHEHLAETRARLAELHDDEVVARLASAVALSGNAHTRLYLLRNATELRRLPIRLWWFADGLYVVRTTPEHTPLLGCRVDAIGGVVARQARDRVAPLFAGNPSWVDYKSVYSLTSPEMLHGVGIVASPDSVPLSLSGCPVPGARHAIVRPLPLARSERTVETWWDLSPLHPGTDSTWVQALPPDALPLYLRHPTRPYWFEYLPDHRVLYFHYSRSDEAEGESTAAFGERLLAALEAHRPAAFVMDVRHNTGGNLHVAAELMEALEARTRGIRRYVITGRATFSAAISHLAAWREAGNVTIVGEPAGDELDYWSEGGHLRLPNSGFEVHFTNGLHSYSTAPCPPDTPCYERSSPPIVPDIPVWTSWAEYLSGRDPAMEAILGASGS
jgi:hypothetical protein